jgi:predicted hydrolase (HD superfamily)
MHLFCNTLKIHFNLYTKADKIYIVSAVLLSVERNGIKMSSIPDYNKAMELLKQYNQEEFHIRHAIIVSGIMGWFALEYDPDNKEFWEIVGLLHDLDFEKYPDQHCIKSQDIMREHGLDERLIRATASHGYNIMVDIKPEHIMEKILYAVDELTGLIGAVAIMRPSRSVADLEVKSVMKKFKSKNFAAGCSRQVISDGADMLGWTLEELIDKTILAMRSLIGKIEI